jgi:hypothetical protein
MVLVAYLLAPTGQRHSVHKNECENHVKFFALYIVTNIIVEVVKYTFIYRYTYNIITVNIANNTFSVLASIFILY